MAQTTTFVQFSREFMVSFLEQETYLSIQDDFVKGNNSDLAFAYIQGECKPFKSYTNDELMSEFETYCNEKLNTDITIALEFRESKDSDFEVLDVKTYTDLHCALFSKIKEDKI